jgi:hypothetical protein
MFSVLKMTGTTKPLQKAVLSIPKAILATLGVVFLMPYTANCQMQNFRVKAYNMK